MLFYAVDKTVVITLVLAFLLLLVLIFLSSKSSKAPAVGITVIYFFGLFNNSVPGASLLLIDWYEYLPKYQTYTGFIATFIGASAFTLGAVLVHVFARTGDFKKRIDIDQITTITIEKFAMMLFGMSVAAQLLIIVFGAIASISAILSALTLLTTFACYLWLWLSKIGFKSKLVLGFSLLAYPAFMLLGGGFLGHGITFITSITIFLLVNKRPNGLVFVLIPVAAFAAFSFSVSYLVARTEFREVIWDSSNLDQRFTALNRLIDQFEWFDSDKQDHLRMIDIRMNQNWLVGVAIESVETGRTEINNGASLADAAVAWIPRAIWADKPVSGGSGNLVSDITGIEFNKETSIGVSHWLELYANFGIAGLFIGMFIVGVTVRYIDLNAGQALKHANVGKFIFMVFLGSAFLNTLGSFAETISSLAANTLAAILVLYVLNQQFPALAAMGRASKLKNTPLLN